MIAFTLQQAGIMVAAVAVFEAVLFAIVHYAWKVRLWLNDQQIKQREEMERGDEERSAAGSG